MKRRSVLCTDEEVGGTGQEYFFLLLVSHLDIKDRIEVWLSFKKTGQRVLSQCIKSGSAPGGFFTGRLFWKMILSMRPGLRGHYRKIVVCVHMSCGTRRGCAIPRHRRSRAPLRRNTTDQNPFPVHFTCTGPEKAENPCSIGNI